MTEAFEWSLVDPLLATAKVCFGARHFNSS
jgi:hypothetical protein